MCALFFARWSCVLTNTFLVLFSAELPLRFEEGEKSCDEKFRSSPTETRIHEISHLTIFLSFNFSFSFSFLSSRLLMPSIFLFLSVVLNASLCSLFFALKLKPVYEGRNVLKIFFLLFGCFFFTFNVSSWLRNTFDLSASLAFCWLALVVVVCANGGEKWRNNFENNVEALLPDAFSRDPRAASTFSPQRSARKRPKEEWKKSILWFHVILLFFLQSFPPVNFLCDERKMKQARERQEQKNLENQSRKTLAFPKAWRASYSPGSQ